MSQDGEGGRWQREQVSAGYFCVIGKRKFRLKGQGSRRLASQQVAQAL
jgi:hypothetical protein